MKKKNLNPKTRQINVGDRVQARYYRNNKARWEVRQTIKRFGQLKYLARLDCDYVFKRRINQLYKTDGKDEIRVICSRARI